MYGPNANTASSQKAKQPNANTAAKQAKHPIRFVW
jgi:hypothetical protein